MVDDDGDDDDDDFHSQKHSLTPCAAGGSHSPPHWAPAQPVQRNEIRRGVKPRAPLGGHIHGFNRVIDDCS